MTYKIMLASILAAFVFGFFSGGLFFHKRAVKKCDDEKQAREIQILKEAQKETERVTGADKTVTLDAVKKKEKIREHFKILEKNEPTELHVTDASKSPAMVTPKNEGMSYESGFCASSDDWVLSGDDWVRLSEYKAGLRLARP